MPLYVIIINKNDKNAPKDMVSLHWHCTVMCWGRTEGHGEKWRLRHNRKTPIEGVEVKCKLCDVMQSLHMLIYYQFVSLFYSKFMFPVRVLWNVQKTESWFYVVRQSCAENQHD